MSNAPFKVAVIGAGSQGQEHMQACGAHPSIELCAVCDKNGDALRQLNSTRETHLCGKIDDLPAGLNGAIVAVPPAFYRATVKALFTKGLDVLIEKPPGVNTADAIGLFEMATAFDRVLIPCAQRRFHLSYIDLARRISGMKPDSCEIVMDIKHRASGWRSADGTGTLLDLGYHAVDLGRMLFGDLALISATFFAETGRPSRDCRDASATLLLHAEAGTWVRVQSARAMDQKQEHVRLRSQTEELYADREGVWTIDHNGHRKTLMTCRADWEDAMAAQLDDWIAICTTGKPCKTEPGAQWAGLTTMRMIEEAYHVNIL